MAPPDFEEIDFFALPVEVDFFADTAFEVADFDGVDFLGPLAELDFDAPGFLAPPVEPDFLAPPVELDFEAADFFAPPGEGFDAPADFLTALPDFAFDPADGLVPEELFVVDVLLVALDFADAGFFADPVDFEEAVPDLDFVCLVPDGFFVEDSAPAEPFLPA